MGDIVTREQVASLITRYFSQQISDEEKVAALNHFRKTLHELSPFTREPVDLVLWVKASEVVANDYNPNVMAAGEKNYCSTHCRRTVLPSPSWCLKRKVSTWSWMVFTGSCWADASQEQENA